MEDRTKLEKAMIALDDFKGKYFCLKRDQRIIASKAEEFSQRLNSAMAKKIASLHRTDPTTAKTFEAGLLEFFELANGFVEDLQRQNFIASEKAGELNTSKPSGDWINKLCSECREKIEGHRNSEVSGRAESQGSGEEAGSCKIGKREYITSIGSNFAIRSINSISELREDGEAAGSASSGVGAEPDRFEIFQRPDRHLKTLLCSVEEVASSRDEEDSAKDFERNEAEALAPLVQSPKTLSAARVRHSLPSDEPQPLNFSPAPLDPFALDQIAASSGTVFKKTLSLASIKIHKADVSSEIHATPIESSRPSHTSVAEASGNFAQSVESLSSGSELLQNKTVEPSYVRQVSSDHLNHSPIPEPQKRESLAYKPEISSRAESTIIKGTQESFAESLLTPFETTTSPPQPHLIDPQTHSSPSEELHSLVIKKEKEKEKLTKASFFDRLSMPKKDGNFTGSARESVRNKSAVSEPQSSAKTILIKPPIRIERKSNLKDQHPLVPHKTANFSKENEKPSRTVEKLTTEPAKESKPVSIWDRLSSTKNSTASKSFSHK